MKRSTRTPAKAVPAQARPMVAKSPERMNAVTRKVTKKMMAVPKSLMSARQPQIAAE